MGIVRRLLSSARRFLHSEKMDSMRTHKGMNLDVLIGNGGIHVFRCSRDRRQLRAVWIFVAVCLLACIAAAILGA